MKLQQDPKGAHHLVSGEIRKDLGQSPTLDTLREAERKHGDPLDRLDLLNTDLHCSECRTNLAERFSATVQGDLLCWECAMGDTADTTEEIARTTDPAKVVLSESNLFHKSLCDYVINVATGCTHGCKFCYVPSTPGVSARGDMLDKRANIEDVQREWGSYLLYRDDLPERLGRKLERKQKWKWTKRGQGVVMLSSGTDCYQDRRTAQITRGCVVELIKHRIPVRILTRSPAVCRDIDLYKRATELTEDGMLIRIGSSIPCLDEKQVSALEPRAPVPSARLNALQELSEAGVPVYVSMSPTYPTQDRDDFEVLIQKFAELDPEVVFHEPINPRGSNFDMTVEAAREAGETELADELSKLHNREHWVEYSLQQMRWAEELGEEYGVNIHIWPDKQVITSVDSATETELRNQRKRPSGESVPDVPLPT